MIRTLVLSVLLVNLVGSVPCVDRAVGLERNVIPDYKMTATSEYNANTKASYGRLNQKANSWCSIRYPVKGKEYLQIDLGSPHIICAISTQGHPKERIWVKKYTIQVSVDGVRWTPFNEFGNEKTFLANKDKNSVVKNVLRSKIIAMFVRIYPMDYNAGNRFCMRLEIYGQRQDECKKPIHLEEKYTSGSVKKIADAYMTASSHFNQLLAAHKGRLYSNSAWCASLSASLDPRLSSKQYLQVDFGEILAVTGLGVQGEASYDYRVNAYLLEYSIDNNIWWKYQEEGVDKILRGPEDKGEIAVTWLKFPILARIIRINPRLWNQETICLRVEIYGCQPPDYNGVIPPKVFLSPVDNVKVEGQASFTCKAAGHPAPNIEWQWKDSAIPGRITMSNIIAVSKLDVHPLKRADSGLVSCVASNGVGQTHQVQFSVDVQYAPEINRDLSTKFVHSIIGDHVVFTCEATGNPAPDIQWETPHKHVTNSSHVTKGNSLIISSVREEDYGVYICKAMNYLGQDQRSIKLQGIEGVKEKVTLYMKTPVPPYALAAICVLASLLVLLAIAHVYVFCHIRNTRRKKTPGSITNQVYHSICCSKPRPPEPQAQAVEMVVPRQTERLQVPVAPRRGVSSQPGIRSSRDITLQQPPPPRSQTSSRSEVEPYEIQTLHENRDNCDEMMPRNNINSHMHNHLVRANSAGYEAPPNSRMGHSQGTDLDTYDAIFPIRNGLSLNGTSESSSYMSLTDRLRDRHSTSSDQNYQALVHKNLKS